uniref:Cytochrome C family protein n=1 Tax=Geobacter sp. (strain M21) TaxID=443144 RepID=C6E386_GEOSM
MNSCRSLKCCNLILSLTMLFLVMGILSVSGQPAHASTRQYVMTCISCHKMPPLDSADGTRIPYTGALKGSHLGHASASTSSCAKCHRDDVANYRTAHRNRLIEISPAINSVAGAAYSRGFFNQTSVPPAILGTCSSVDCHFESTTPSWGTTVLKAPEDCSACHGSAPADGNHPGSGQKHGVYYDTGTGSCAVCHPDHLGDAKPFAHATSAGSRALAVQFTTLPNKGGSYSRDLSYPNYLPSKSGLRNGSCLGLYCHSPGNKNSSFDPPNQAATWGGTLNCAGCHKAGLASGSVMTSGSHGKHVDGSVSSFACSKCHFATATSSMTIADVTQHVNGRVDIFFGVSTSAANGSYNGLISPVSKLPGSGYGACSNVYCHSNGQSEGGVGIAYRTPIWGSGTTGKCGSCHADGSGHNDAVPAMSSGSHKKHLSYTLLATSGPVRCTICHNVKGAKFTAYASCSQMSCHSTGGAIKHSDQEIDVSLVSYFGGVYDGTRAPGDGYGACANVYCHSNGQATPSYAPPVTWGAVTLRCDACHGSATSKGGSDTTTSLSGKHAAHVNNALVLGAGKSLHCIDCHSITVSSDTTIASTAVHVNKMLNYTGHYAGGPRRYSSTTKVCSNIYCHSSGQAKPVFRNMTGTKSWASTGTLSCNGCHGYGPGTFASVAGEPNYLNGGAGSGTANSHQKHMAGANLLDSRGCAKCHRSTADQGMAGKLRDYSSAHLNGSRDVSFAVLGNISGHYSAAAKTCSNTYCHGGGSIQWGGQGPLACNSCHGDAETLGTNAHARHISPSSGKAISCAICHAATAAGNGSIADGTIHADGKKDVVFSGAALGTQMDLTGNCSTSYCHSNGKGSYSTPNWSANSSGACGTCHATAPGLGSPLIASGAHFSHFSTAATSYGPMFSTGNVTGCQACHDFGNELASTHIDQTVNVNSSLGYSTSGTCTPCHTKEVSWTGGAVSCESCHAGTLSVINGVTASDKSQAATRGHGGPTIGKGCTDCHERNARHINGGSRLRAQFSGGLNLECNYCHDDSSVLLDPDSRNMSTHVLVKGGTPAMECAQCHDPHGSNNLKMIRAVINGKEIVFNDMMNGLIDTVTNQGICQVCHTQTSHYRAGIPETDHPTSGCLSCHPHVGAEAAFLPQSRRY